MATFISYTEHVFTLNQVFSRVNKQTKNRISNSWDENIVRLSRKAKIWMVLLNKLPHLDYFFFECYCQDKSEKGKHVESSGSSSLVSLSSHGGFSFTLNWQKITHPLRSPSSLHCVILGIFCIYTSRSGRVNCWRVNKQPLLGYDLRLVIMRLQIAVLSIMSL